MRKILSIVLTVFSISTVFGQAATQKVVIVTKSSKTVPIGKKWILEANKETKVQLSDGVFKSGTLCNASFLSNPKMVMNVNKGDLYKSEGYGIVFKDPEKVPYTNDVTYTLTPIAFVDKDFSVYEFQTKKPEDVGTKKLVFKAGESVFVSSCLVSIEMIEISMTTQELADEKKKQDEAKKARNEKAKNFCIPIKPQGRAEPGTKPALKDSLIEYVVFESPAVLFSTRNGRRGLDDVHQWTITLTQTSFTMKSSNYDETYTVLGARYYEQLQMQEFQLADETGTLTHTVDLSWDSMSGYSVLFGSVDFKDDYQFQQVALKEIKHQNR